MKIVMSHPTSAQKVPERSKRDGDCSGRNKLGVFENVVIVYIERPRDLDRKVELMRVQHIFARQKINALI